MSVNNNNEDDEEFQRHLKMEEEDGRSWIQLYDENASLRNMLRQAMEKNNNNISSNKNKSASATPRASESKDHHQEVEKEEKPISNNNSFVDEIANLKTQILQYERLMKILNEECKGMAMSLEKVEHEVMEKYDITRANGKTSTSDNSDSNEDEEEQPTKNGTDAFLFSPSRSNNDLLQKFTDRLGSSSSPMTTSFIGLFSQVRSIKSLLRKKIPSALSKMQQRSRAALETETHSLQQIVTDLSARCHEAELSVKQQKETFQKQSEEAEKMNKDASKRIDTVYQEMEDKMQSILQEKEGLQSQRDQATAAHEDAQRKLDALSFEMGHKMKQQERMSTLLQQQLQRSQKQLEEMTAEIQKNALSPSASSTPTSHHQLQRKNSSSTISGIINSAVPQQIVMMPYSTTSTSTSSPTIQHHHQQDPSSSSASSLHHHHNHNHSRQSSGDQQQQKRSRGNSLTGNGSSSASNTFAGGVVIGNDDGESLDKLRKENIELIHRLAATQEKVWALEMTKKSYEEQLETLDQRVSKQAEIIRSNVGVKSICGNSNSSNNNSFTNATKSSSNNASSSSNTVPAPPTTSGGLFSSMFSRNKQQSSGSSSSQQQQTSSPLLHGAGSIPLAIVHSTHLQQALEDALSDCAMWKEKAMKMNSSSQGGGEDGNDSTGKQDEKQMALPPLMTEEDEDW